MMILILLSVLNGRHLLLLLLHDVSVPTGTTQVFIMGSNYYGTSTVRDLGIRCKYTFTIGICFLN